MIQPSKNDITGDSIVSKKPTDAYRDGWSKIFEKQKQEDSEVKKDADTSKE